MNAREPLQVTLYMKPGCHLCAQAVAELQRLQQRQPHELRQISIDAEPELLQRFGERIPVLVVAGREYVAPLPRAVLEQALRDGARGSI